MLDVYLKVFYEGGRREGWLKASVEEVIVSVAGETVALTKDPENGELAANWSAQQPPTMNVHGIDPDQYYCDGK